MAGSIPEISPRRFAIGLCAGYEDRHEGLSLRLIRRFAYPTGGEILKKV